MKPIHGYIQDIFRSDYNFIATRIFEFRKFCVIRIIEIHLKIITEYYYLFYLPEIIGFYYLTLSVIRMMNWMWIQTFKLTGRK